jgi:hypothetical protein
MATANVVGPAGQAGGGSAPVPWWQLPNQPIAANNLDASAPPGYQYDRVQMRYVPILGSPTDALAQRTRAQGQQDQMLDALMRQLTFGSASSGGGGDYASAPAPTSASSAPGVSMGGSSAPVQMVMPSPGAAPAAPATITMPDTKAAQDAIFARAKDKVGLETAGSVTALRSALAARGLLGGGAEVKGTANVLTSGQQQLGDTTREGAIQEAGRLNDFAKLGYQGAIEQRGQDITTSEGAANRALQAAVTNYTGQVSQRGQDVNQNEAEYSGNIAQRGQNLSASEGAANRALTASDSAANRALAARGQTLASTQALLSRLY